MIKKLSILIGLVLGIALIGMTNYTKLVPQMSSDFTITLSPTHQTCPNVGKVEVSLADLTTGGNVEITLKDTDSNSEIYTTSETVTAATLDYTFNNVDPGNYEVTVVHNFGSESLTKTQTTIVENHYAPLSVDLTFGEDCTTNTNSITATVSEGSPTKYQLKKKNSDGDYVFETEQTTTDLSVDFTGLSDGEYRVVVFDTCNQTRGIDTGQLTFDPNELAFQTYTLRSVEKISCDEIKVKIKFNQNLDYAYPITVTVTNYLDEFGAAASDPLVIELADETASHEFQISVYNLGQTLTFNAEEGCGVSTGDVDVELLTASALSQHFSLGCGQQKEKVSFTKRLYGNKTLIFLQYPSTFDPDINDIGMTFSLNSDNDWESDDPIDPSHYYMFFGDDTHPLPNGTYRFKIIDQCGAETTEGNFRISDRTPEITERYRQTGCDLNHGSIYFQLLGAGTLTPVGDITGVTITTPAQGYTGPINFTEADMDNNGAFNFENAIAGTYTADFETTCGTITGESFTVVGREMEDPTVTAVPGCGFVNVSYSVTSNTSSNVFWLQRYNPNTDEWVHPTTGQSNFQINEENAKKMTGPNTTEENGNNSLDVQWGNMIQFTGSASANDAGLYRVMHQFKALDDLVCYEEIGQYRYEYRPKLEDYYVFQCSGQMNIAVDATGAEPLKYTLLSEDGTTEVKPEQTDDPVFTGVPSGNYQVRIMDRCDNTFVVNVAAQDMKLPRIKGEDLCDGSIGRLYVRGLSYMTVEWTNPDNSNFTPITTGPGQSSTTHEVIFNTFESSTDWGEYKAHFTYNGDSCFNDDPSFTVSSTSTTPNAGTGQTAEINAHESPANVDLFDYITGTPDDFGDFTIVSPAGHPYLNDNLFDVGSAETGEYVFEYRVAGYCEQPDDVTTITLTLKNICTQSATAAGTTQELDNVGISTEDVTLPNWPKAVKNTQLVLTSKDKGLVVTRTAASSITTPEEGMLIWDTTDNCLKLFNGDVWNCLEQSCNE